MKLTTVAPENTGGVQVETMSIPWVRVEKSLIKNRKRGQRFGGGDAIGQQESAIFDIGADKPRQGQTIGDSNTEVVGGQRERTVVDHEPCGDVSRCFGPQRDGAVALRRCERGGDGYRCR